MRTPILEILPLPKSGKIGWPWKDSVPVLLADMPNGSPWPLISIVTPSFNQAEFLEETIRSVLLQGYPNLEYIIIDGGSQDGSVDIIKKYESWLAYWASEPDRGQCHAINKGFQRASGQIYAFINADDYYLPKAFEHVAASYKPGIGLWAGTTLQIGLDGVLKGERKPRSLAFDDVADWQVYWFRQPGCFFSKAVFEEVGGLDETLNYSLDFDLWLRMIRVSKGEIVNARLAVARNHPKMKTQIKCGKGFAEDRLVQIRNGAEDIAVKEMVKLYEQVESYENKLRPFITFINFLRRLKSLFLSKLLGIEYK